MVNKTDFSVNAVLSAVIDSGVLGKSERQAELLKFLLRETKAGRAEAIKEYAIAVDILGRSEDFDSGTDSIVRVEMHRLRKNLDRFSSKSDSLHLSIPKGGYEILIEEDVTQPAPRHRLPLKKIPVFLSSTVMIVTLVVSASQFIPRSDGCNDFRPIVYVEPFYIGEGITESNLLPALEQAPFFRFMSGTESDYKCVGSLPVFKLNVSHKFESNDVVFNVVVKEVLTEKSIFELESTKGADISLSDATDLFFAKITYLFFDLSTVTPVVESYNWRYKDSAELLKCIIAFRSNYTTYIDKPLETCLAKYEDVKSDSVTIQAFLAEWYGDVDYYYSDPPRYDADVTREIKARYKKTFDRSVVLNPMDIQVIENAYFKSVRLHASQQHIHINIERMKKFGFSRPELLAEIGAHNAFYHLEFEEALRLEGQAEAILDNLPTQYSFAPFVRIVHDYWTLPPDESLAALRDWSISDWSYIASLFYMAKIGELEAIDELESGIRIFGTKIGPTGDTRETYHAKIDNFFAKRNWHIELKEKTATNAKKAIDMYFDRFEEQ